MINEKDYAYLTSDDYNRCDYYRNRITGEIFAINDAGNAYKVTDPHIMGAFLNVTGAISNVP